MDPSLVAACGSLAMLLEASASPKPGNVGPRHGRFEHFIASALACRPALEGAAREGRSLGRWFRRAVEASARAQPGGNTHFGTFLLLVPLAAGAGERWRGPRPNPVSFRNARVGGREGGVRGRARRMVRATTVEDAVEFYRAFRAAPVRVAPLGGPLDLRSSRAVEALRKREVNLFDAVTMAAGRDRVAKEWANGFAECEWARGRLALHLRRRGWNDALVRTYLDLLARAPDSLVAVKFGKSVAREVQRRAALLRGASPERIARWDGALVRQGINPGSTADVLAAALFLHLAGP